MADRPNQDTKAASTQAPVSTNDAAESGLRSIDAVAGMTRQNMETMLSVAQGAVRSFETMTTGLAAFSRASAERTTNALQAMTAVTSPGDLLKMQADFSRQQMEAAMAEMTKLSQVMINTARESLAVSMDSVKPRGDDQ
jgi:hypothetical protein